MTECILKSETIDSDDESSMPSSVARHYLCGSGVSAWHPQGSDINDNHGISEKRVAEESCIAVVCSNGSTNVAVSARENSGGDK